MQLIAGTRLGPYEIQSPLGSGGMGEVYRARDTKLHRSVAIKVISGLSREDPEQLMRFGREARLLASLNHPRIAQIYGFEDFHLPGDGRAPVPALVMELVEGPTLADRLVRGALPLGEALAIARQIAEALEAAHEQGVIHRDLKPANIKVMDDGAVKVLDFGLAKALVPRTDSDAAHHLTPDAMNSPTHARPLTASGVVLGTAAYMAPEQARGKPVDRRADVWALGVVLYEMLAGRRLFEGETFSDVMAAVLRQDIDWTRLPDDLPEELYRLMRRCLEREPKNRLRDAADVRLVIEEVIDDLDRDGRSSNAARNDNGGRDFGGRGRGARGVRLRDERGRGERAAARVSGPTAQDITLIVAIAIIAAIAGALIARSDWMNTPATTANSAGAGAGAGVGTGAASRQSSARFAIEPPADVTSVSNVTVAADGRFVVYEGQVDGESRLFLRRFDALDSHEVPGTEGARSPFISPDGAWIGFFREGKIFRISAAGGDVLPICDVRGGPGAVWDSRSRIIFARTWLGGLLSVPAEGGTPTPLTTPDRAKKEIGHWWPSMLPDGRVLFTVVAATSGFNDSHVAVLDPATGAYRVLFQGARATWLPSGHIMFYRIGKYQAVRFDLAAGRVIGEPFPVLEDAQELDPLGDWPQPVFAGTSGVLAYLPGAYVPPSRLTWIDAKGAFTPLAFAPRPFVSVRLSPDGKRGATASLEAGRLLIRLFDLERGTEEAPKIDGMNWNPAWLPDGRLSFTSMRKGDFDVYVKDAGGIGEEHAFLAGFDDTDPVAWTRDGRLVFQGSEPDGAYPLKLVDPREPSRIVRLTEQHVENGGAVSPDDRWLLYQSAATGRTLVYARPLTGEGPAAPLSMKTGEFPVFLPDGRTLAFVRNGRLVVMPWRSVNGRFDIGSEHHIAALTVGTGWMYGTPYDAARDGRFLAIVRTEAAPPVRIRVVLGWDRDVARLDPSDRP